jgi:hypothetical protein
MADLISIITTDLFPFIMGIFATIFSTITGNPLLFLPVCIAIAATGIFYVISLVRKFGVRGVSGGGRRRRR